VHGTRLQRALPRQAFLALALAFFLAASLAGCATAPRKGGMDTPATQKEANIRLDLAESYLGNKEPRRALKELQLIESRARHFPRYHNLLGHTYLVLNEYDRAEQSFAQVLTLDPDFAEAFVSLGTAQAFQGKLEMAERSFKQALEVLTYETPELAAHNLAQLYFSQDRLGPAEQYAKLAVEKNWRYIPGYLLLSDLLNTQGKSREAVAWLRKGTEADLNNVQVTMELGLSLIRLGEFDEAKKWFRHVIQTSPQSDEAKMASDYLEMY
jgi:type IV pilus assembly protein PilF